MTAKIAKVVFGGLIAFCFAINLPGQCADLIVALDGSGDYTSVQEAIDAAPSNLESPFIIYVKDGTYDEKLFIEKNFVTLIGESRDSTIITTAVLRRLWREEHPSDWGAATVNVASDATDLTLANMTIRNNFADVYPDTPNPNDHTFAIRGGGHRVIIFNCKVVTTGGDTLSLWNTDGGMFYHNNCFFEGYVDYVAPRGYCYITDSEFFGYNSHASIWHDGSGGEGHKLVIRRSTFDGVPGFALGRHHKEAAFYLLDCFFTDNMQTDEGIEFVGSEPLMWGKRYYYYNTHWGLVDFPWNFDNLEEAAGSPAAEEIDAAWTFNGEWEPESQLDELLPFAFLPSPRSGEACAAINPTLSWTKGHCALYYNVYMGTAPDELSFAANTIENTYTADNLSLETAYFWRVDVVTDTDTIMGETWSFITERESDAPYPAFKPEPADGSDYFTNLVKIDWDYHACNTDSFVVYVGLAPDNLEYKKTQKYPGYFIFSGQDDSTYYWRIDAINENGLTQGEVWSFTLNPSPNSTREQGPDGLQLEQNQPNPFKEKTLIRYRLPQKGHVRLGIYNLNGQLVQEIVNMGQSAGIHETEWTKKKELSSGIYICRLIFEGRYEQNIRLAVE